MYFSLFCKVLSENSIRFRSFFKIFLICGTTLNFKTHVDQQFTATKAMTEVISLHTAVVDEQLSSNECDFMGFEEQKT